MVRSLLLLIPARVSESRIVVVHISRLLAKIKQLVGKIGTNTAIAGLQAAALVDAERRRAKKEK